MIKVVIQLFFKVSGSGLTPVTYAIVGTPSAPRTGTTMIATDFTPFSLSD
jgi:hypothetical protein